MWYKPAEEKRELLMRKGVYPYEYMAPHISDEEYRHAQRVWEVFNCKTMGTTTISTTAATSYCWTFRKTCLRQYGLDPANYYTSRVLHGLPCARKRGLSWSFSPITTNISSSRRVWVVASAWPQSAMQGLTTPRLRAMTQKSQIVAFYTWMRTTSTAGQ